LKCLLKGHVKGEAYEYRGMGMVVEVCIRCGKKVGRVPVDDWEFGDLLIEFLVQERTPLR
jgi:hypothetical protein